MIVGPRSGRISQLGIARGVQVYRGGWRRVGGVIQPQDGFQRGGRIVRSAGPVRKLVRSAARNTVKGLGHGCSESGGRVSCKAENLGRDRT